MMTESRTMASRRGKNEDLREACVQEAIAIISTTGIDSLSLREVSRRLGVSHQAPYKHFPSRDHILAEVVTRTFDSFAQYLDERQPARDPFAELEAMGRAYLAYALARPLQYQLMFNTPLPSAAEHPQMMRSAQHAFALLRDCIQRLHLTSGMAVTSEDVERDALFVWSTMHGMAAILQSQVLDKLALSESAIDTAIEHTLQRITLSFQPR